MKRIAKSTLLHKSLGTIVLALVAALAVAPAAEAEQFPTGFFIGIDAGAGGSMVAYRGRDRSINEDPEFGAMGGLRLGYGLSPQFAISLESHGFGRGEEEKNNEWSLGVGVVALTWRPWSNGFYVRSGLGTGGGDFRALDMTESVTIEHRFAWTFALGYDWRLGEHTSLGLALEGFEMDAGDVTGYEDDSVGAGGATVQFTWHP